MNFSKNSLFISLIFSVFLSIGQDLTYSDYKWNPTPSLHTLSKEDSLKFELIIKDKVAIEYIVGNEGGLEEYQLKHRIIRVNSNDAIEKNNRIYLPLQDPNNLLITKARVIKPNGKVQELNKNNIQEATDQESNQTYKYFAFEGIELGSEIEYLYLIKTPTIDHGRILPLQSGVEKKNIDVDIISPRAFIFEAISLNGLADLQLDTTIKEKNILHLHVDQIPIAKKEDFSVFKPNLQQIHYKLQYSLYSGVSPYVSYKKVTEGIYDMIYQPIYRRQDFENKSSYKEKIKTRKKDKKLVKNFLKNINLSNAKTDIEKVRAIEDYIKDSLHVVEAPFPELDNFSFIFEKKVGSENGFTKLFVEILNQLDIETELVITSDRNVQKFDPNFETYDGLQKFLIYLPESKIYLSPTHSFSRLQYIPHELTHNYGLFIQPMESKSVKTAIGSVKFIDPLPADATIDKLSLDIQFDENAISTLNIDLNREISGYYAQYYQPYYDVLDPSVVDQFNESLVKYIGENIDIQKITVENKGSKNFGIKPLIVKADLVSNGYMERARGKYIFKIGELIGPQAEMYQETKRKFDVENDFNRKYIRSLRFHVPEGYQVKNLDALNMDVFHEKDGKRTMAFTSSYAQEGNTVTVKIVEFYENITYDVAVFEEFRKVINAAADFNKIVLFIEK